MDAAPEFTLTLSVTGPGVGIDPATGAITIAADRLLAGIAGSFRLTAAALPLAAPRLVAAPALAGPAVIGQAVTVDPGVWEGAAVLALEWRRDGAAIAGATGLDYTPVAADDGARLDVRVTATNVVGSTAAGTEALAVAHAAPRVAGTLADLDLELDTGTATVAAAAAFAGEGLAFAVAGAGASVDARTGVVAVPTGVLRDGAAVTVTASNSGGSAQAGFAVRVRGVAPALLAQPKLAGTGKVGAAATVDAGSWSGKPAPTLARQWRRDGADIAGATGPSYTAVAADDGRALTCRVTATNAAGTASATTAALAITRVAPTATAPLADVSLVQGASAGSVAAASAFAGEGLGYAVTGGGATIDAATGRVTLPTAVLRAAETVTVTATNSGGSASASFRVTVAVAGVPAPAAVGRIADVSFPLDGGTWSVSTQSHFAGSGLTYALAAAPAGVTIHAGSGLIEVRTAAALAAATVTVRASNAGGSATQSFALTVEAAPATGATSVFNAAAALADLGFVAEGAAPAWALKGGTQARLTPAATGRTHADWKRAGGDGLYRALVRWNATNTGARGSSPFVFGARIARTGANFAGLYVEATRISGTERQLRLQQYTGAGTATTLLATAVNDWVWYSWYWFEMELRGAAVKARLYARDTAAPAWQLEATTTHTAAGLFGPSAFPTEGIAPFLDVQRLEFVSGGTTTVAPTPPAAAADGDWDLNEITEQK